MPVSQWTTIVVVLVIESLVFGATYVAPLNGDAKRWIAAGTLIATAVGLAWRFLR